MKYLSRNQAEQWLNQHTLYGKKIKILYLVRSIVY